jgi:lysophospholipase L1-like esterase
MIRFAALGDSITLGIGDAMPDGAWRGWARLLADSLGEQPVAFHNLATSGARTVDVAGEQLRAALPLRPQLASVVVGVNDTLRDRFDLAAVGRALTTAVAELVESGAVVLTARLPDPGRMLGIPKVLARPLARRIHAVNAVADHLAERYRTVHFDAAGHPSTYDSPMWSVDRLHPSERGHRLLARSFAELLADRGFPVRQLPALAPSNPEPTRRAQAWWMATRGTRWVVDRATDLVPDLARLAAVECWYRLRGITAELDQRVHGELGEALAGLDGIRLPEPVPGC